jgi:lysophospholipase L1-like esterase
MRIGTRTLSTVLSVLLTASLGATLVGGASAAAPAHGGGPRWTGTWTSSQIASFPGFPGVPNWSGGLDNHSVRQVVRASRGGSTVRIRVSNVYGAAPLRLTGASIARAGEGPAVLPGTLRPVRFGRSQSAVVPAGREAVSDAVALRVSPLERLTVTLYFATPTGPSTFHLTAQATVYRATGDHLYDQGGGSFGETSDSSYYLSGVEVSGQHRGSRGAVVAFGDSITDGVASTLDTDNRYPDELAERLVAAGRPVGVLNAGISGNQVLADAAGFGERATARFQRDVLDQPGVRTVIVLEGINDIGLGALNGMPVTAQQLIEGHRALIRAAHAHRVKIIGATLTPFEGAMPGYYTDEGEAVRDELNHWIRTSGEYDAVVDMERALADPADPDRLRPEFDSGDGLHPNDAGMRAMAAAVDLRTL